VHVSLQRDTAFHFQTPEQRVKVVNVDVCKKPTKLIGSHRIQSGEKINKYL